MSSEPDELLEPYYDGERRLAKFNLLVKQGLIEKKAPEQITEADLDLVDSHLLIDEQAEQTGITVEELFANWDEELGDATLMSAAEMMEWLRSSDP